MTCNHTKESSLRWNNNIKTRLNKRAEKKDGILQRIKLNTEIKNVFRNDLNFNPVAQEKPKFKVEQKTSEKKYTEIEELGINPDEASDNKKKGLLNSYKNVTKKGLEKVAVAQKTKIFSKLAPLRMFLFKGSVIPHVE